MKRAVAVAGLILVLTSIAALGPAAAGESPQDVANSISEQIMSPFCPGVTLHDCPSDNAIQLRSQIARWAARGWTRDRIMTKLLSEYTDIRAVPPDRGAALLIWLLPAGAVIAGAAIAAVLARRWTHTTPSPPTAPELGPQERHRLEEELAIVRSEP
jgi:cytochrome c-type biogenesis protein CcmH